MSSDDDAAPFDEPFTETMKLFDRTFQKHALTNGIYFAPVDKREVEQLGLMHSVLRQIFDGRLIFPPIASLSKVLECGCGAGHWAIEVAEQFPDSEVLGIDISPHMIPENPPKNFVIQIDDLNEQFSFPGGRFDFVHSQMMAGGIHAPRWTSYILDIFRILKPGGWCQLVEVYFNAQSDNGTLEEAHALSRWSKLYLDSMHPYKNSRAALQLPGWMRSAGFVDVESRLLTLPMCAWGREVRDQNIGRANAENVAHLLSSLALYPFTQLKGMSIGEFERLVEEARREAVNPAFKAYFPLYVCIGRKPPE